MPIAELMIGGDRIWADATVAGTTFEIRESVAGDRLVGTWTYGFVNSGRLGGRRAPR